MRRINFVLTLVIVFVLAASLTGSATAARLPSRQGQVDGDGVYLGGQQSGRLCCEGYRN